MQAQVEAPKGGGTRPEQKGDVIRGRSRASYRRLLWAIAATVHMFRYESWFVSLTHGKHAPGWMESKRTFNKWQSKAVRKFPTLKGIWVAGESSGAPHYHLLLTGVGPAAMGWMQLSWYRDTGDEGSNPDARKRHAFDARIYGESQADAAVEQYLAQVASRELGEGSQQDTTVRTWGYCNRQEMESAVVVPEFAALDVRTWCEERARNALEIAGRNAGLADVVTNGEFIRGILHWRGVPGRPG